MIVCTFLLDLPDYYPTSATNHPLSRSRFQELKEATRNAAAQQKPGSRQNGVHASSNQQSNIIAPPSSIATSTGGTQTDAKSDFTREMLINSTIKQPLAIHQRSQSLSGLQLSKVFTKYYLAGAICS